MISLRLRPLLALSVVAALGACERHDWEDTKVLFKSHGEDHANHGEGHDHGDHGQDHTGHGDHQEGHGEAEKH